MKPKPPFPSTIYYANAIELFERFAWYGLYVGLSLYLTNVVKFSDLAAGAILGNVRLVTSLAPIPCGAIADRITFKRSLAIAFALLVFGYGALLLFPTKGLAVAALLCAAVGSGFMKPVITGTIVRAAPEGRENEGFALFYRMINSGSVLGKSLAYVVRAKLGLAFVAMNSSAASLVALGLAVFGYKEPERGRGTRTDLGETMRGYADALKNVRFTLFLVVSAGFYFMAEQFYMTFPKYVTRHIDARAPLEIIMLINPALIALFQGAVTRATGRLAPLTTMFLGVLVGAVSMLVMGGVPGILGACLSGAIFAFSEMLFSPRFYAFVGKLAPEGKAGMYMGLAFVPAAIGAWIGGQASGALITRYLPQTGPRDPFTIWSIYAALGAACGVLLLGYRLLVRDVRPATA